MECVNLCSDDEENVGNTPAPKTSLGKRKLEKSNTSSATEDDEVVECSAADAATNCAPPAPPSTAAATGKNTEDEDVQIVGRRGDLALADFPHSRAHCVEVPFVAGNKDKCFLTCKNCWCF